MARTIVKPIDVKDIYGSPLEVGTKVAFNYSGEVRLGTITNISFYTPYGTRHIQVMIQHQDAVHHSVIRNILGVAAIPALYELCHCNDSNQTI